MACEYILFDLDGTLTDPAEGIFNSVYYALARMGRERPPLEKMPYFIGPPLVDGFSAMCGMSYAEAERARDLFREYYPEHGIYECRMYEGIPETLASLVARGFRLVLATSKPEIYARRILDRFDLTRYFTYVAGSLLDESRSQKHEVIAYALQTLGISDPGACVMVGDRAYDVRGAAVFSIPCVGVLWGHGSEEELTEAGAALVVKDQKELLAFFACGGAK